MKSYTKVGVSATLIISMFFTGSVGFADDVTKEKQQLNKVNSVINKAKNKLTQNKKKEKDLNSQIATLDKKINVAEKEIDKIDQEIGVTKGKIVTTKKELRKAEINIANKNDILNSRLRVMYKNGQIGYAEVLLNSESIVDFFSNVDMLQKIFHQDQELLAYMKEQKEEIIIKKRTLEDHESNMKRMMRSMESKQKELEVNRGEIRRVKEELKKDSKQLAKQIDEFNAYAEKLTAEIRRKQSSGKYTGGKLAWPTPGYTRITSPYGYRIHPILKRKKMHTGIDIGAPRGASVVAAGNGKVIYSDWRGGYGKVVMVDHGGGIVTLYAHNSKLLVKDGQKVNKGTTIAKIGSTGGSTGPHLHFEVRKNGKWIDPIPWVK